MARDVAQTVKGMLAKHLHLSEPQAEEYFFQLKVRCGVLGTLSSQAVFHDGDRRLRSHARDLAGCCELRFSRMPKEKSLK